MGWRNTLEKKYESVIFFKELGAFFKHLVLILSTAAFVTQTSTYLFYLVFVLVVGNYIIQPCT